MEAASLRTVRRVPRPSRMALVALAAYGALLVAGWQLISSAREAAGPAGSATGGTASTPASDPETLALASVGSRAQRSTVGAGSATGFVAWTANGLTLVLTARPAAGWGIRGADRSVRVAYGPGYFEGTLVRADVRYGLGLIRVREDGIAAALWQQRRPVQVRPGERVVLVGRNTSTTAEIVRIGDRRITLAPPAERSLTGGPVLDGAGQVIGVIASDGAAIPIARACGVIRRC